MKKKLNNKKSSPTSPHFLSADEREIFSLAARHGNENASVVELI
jgi:hypothetical protein